MHNSFEAVLQTYAQFLINIMVNKILRYLLVLALWHFFAGGAFAHTTYEALEHVALGNNVTIPWPTFNISGADFKYNADGFLLSFGDITALAGDFYGNFGCETPPCTQCLEQISDHYDEDPQRSVALFKKIAASLANNTNNLALPGSHNISAPGYLACALALLHAERREVEERVVHGEDAAQVYSSGEFVLKHALTFTVCTAIGYPQILFCNWDHFNVDAIKSYKAGHTAALEQAAIAHRTFDNRLLKKAYFLEAFAQHYLTDMFAAGHLRTRRRLFHNTGILAATPSFATPSSVFPADICLHRQHEEDNANGLWVRNHMGDEWALYGDKELFSAKSLIQFDQNVKACQAGIDEVYSTFHTGLRPPPNDYEALNLIPRIDEDISNGYRNFAPLFRHNKSDPDHIYFRTKIDDRNSYDYTKYNRSSLGKELGHGSWNLHPYTKEFRSSRKIIHVRKGHETEIIVNIYGSRDGEPWTMLAQTILCLQPSHPKTTWASVLNPTPTVVILVGSVRGSPSGFARRHVILSVLPNLSIRLVQDDIEDVRPDFKNVNSQVGSMGESVIGQFARGSDQWALFTYTCNGRDRHAIDMYAISPYRGFEPLSYSPLASQINTFPVGGQISHMITLDGPPWSASVGPVKSYYKHNQNVSAFLALGFDAIKQKTFWFFGAWQVGAKRRDEGMTLRYDIEATTTVPGSSALLRPPNALLTHPLLQSSSSQCIVSIYSFLHGGELHVVVELWHADPNGYLQKLEKASLEFEDWRKWHINSGHNFTQHYNISWNLIDVNQDGIVDLVGLITDCGSNTNHTAVTVVLPGLRHDRGEDYKGYPISGFSNYVISRLVPDSPKWANRFMVPLNIHNVEYITSGPQPVVSQAGILMFFDNFGVLGARLIAPVHDDGHDFKYELKGQTPAIAGQVSSGLNRSPEDVMGTANSKKLIGILPLKD